MATINASQDYDIIQTLHFAEASGTCKIGLYRGSNSAYTGTVKVRAGTSGTWSDLSVSGTSTTFNVTSTTMQIAHDWNKSGNNYMTCSFYGQSTNLTKIAISQKAVLSGAIGNYFMNRYAQNGTNLTSLDIPDTSGITSVGNYFRRYYASNCNALTTLVLPSVGWFATHNVAWTVPASRLTYLKGAAINSAALDGWKALTTDTSPNTLYL